MKYALKLIGISFAAGYVAMTLVVWAYQAYLMTQIGHAVPQAAAAASVNAGEVK